MLKNYSQLLLGILIGLLAGLLIAKLFISSAPKETNKTYTTVPQQQSQKERNSGVVNNSNTNANSQDNNYSGNEKIPQKVLAVLAYIKTNNKAMDGYVGGRVFQNREKQLPMGDDNGNKISYQEWDVNPKVQGKNRGTERLCTGSDGRSWYTNDHYRTFTQIK
jgi:ribonuclease T1